MKRRAGDRDWYVLAAFAGFVAVVWLFAFRPLVYAPGDRARVARIVSRPATRAVDPGPVEASLYRLADAHRRLFLLIDTTNPEDDPKQWARACDAADREACTRIATFFIHFLGAPVLGMRLWVEACGSGIDAACTRAAEQFARDALPSFDLPLAQRLFRLGCTAIAVDPSGCLYAADPDRIFGRHGPRPEAFGVPTREARPDLLFFYLDRGCELLAADVCGALAWDLAEPTGALPRNEQLHDYYRALDVTIARAQPAELVALRAERIASGSPAGLESGAADEPIVAQKRRLLTQLEHGVLRARAEQALSPYRRAEAHDSRSDRPTDMRMSGLILPPLELGDAATPCVRRCPSEDEAADLAAARRCLCGCLLDTRASDVPPSTLTACRDGEPPGAPSRYEW